MDKKAMRLLDKSIKNWTDIVTDREYEFRCPLCTEYGDEEDYIYECSRCPITIITGKVNCFGTSFYYTLKSQGSKCVGNTIMLTELYQIRRCMITGNAYVPTE